MKVEAWMTPIILAYLAARFGLELAVAIYRYAMSDPPKE